MKAGNKASLDLKNVSMIETELTINPKGSVKLSIDLEKRLLKWQESNRWNRNFTRTLSLLEIKEIKNFMEKQDFSSWPEAKSKRGSAKKESDFQSIWSLRIYGAERQVLFAYLMHDDNPAFFQKFCDGISMFCRQTFTVSD